LRIPFTDISLHKIANPERGDIVIFDSNSAQKRLVKRVIGIPGDRIAMLNNHLFINDKPIKYSPDQDNIGSDWIEHLSKADYSVRIPYPAKTYSSFETIAVPAEHYLVLGDNRNNSADSRVIGFVPREEIIGRTNKVVYSLDYNNWYLPRPSRFLRAL